MIISDDTLMIVKDHYEGVFKFLNERFGSCYSNTDFYTKVDLWLRLYQGYVKEHHEILNNNGISAQTRRMSVLNMAKRVAEDWTSILVSDKPIINIAGKNQSTSRFIQGSKGNGGVLNSNNFYKQFTNVIERAFSLGTGALVLGITLNKDKEFKIDINSYNANAIIPIKYHNGIITECAFLSKFERDGKTMYNLSCHVKDDDDTYIIYNFEAGSDLNFGSYLNNDVEGFNTNSKTPFFFIISPMIANNVDLDSPMGVSVYSSAVDIVLNCDYIYDSIKMDVLTAQRIILMDKTLLGIGTDGKPIPPQDVKKYFMAFFGDEGSTDVDKLIKEFSPKLNSTELCETLQQNLNLLSMRCGLGNQYYHFDKVAGVTATEYTGSQQDLVRNVRINTEMLTNIITGLVKQIIWIGGNLFEYELPQDVKVTVTIPDGVVTDDLTEKEQDRQDVRDGIMSKAEYRAKWYGETLEDAKLKIADVKSELNDTGEIDTEKTTITAGFTN